MGHRRLDSLPDFFFLFEERSFALDIVYYPLKDKNADEASAYGSLCLSHSPTRLQMK